MLRNLFFIGTFLWGAFALQAQQQTLFNNLDVTGAFGSVIVEGGNLNGEFLGDVGGGGALMMSPVFIGGYGMGTKRAIHTIKDGPDAGQYDMKFSHGGLWLGFVPKADKLIHPYGSLKIGWGKTRLRFDEDGDNIFRDNIFVLTPELGFEVNLTEWLKMSVTGGYRLVNGVNEIPDLTNDDLSSFIGIISFHIGGFEDF
ncbi:MAG: hypothetical protein AAGJ82_03670 [Bacteroidota bacterium]